jgi:hypothetical protein
MDRAKPPHEPRTSFKLCFGPWQLCHLFDLWDVAGSLARLVSCAALQGGKGNGLHRLACLQIKVIVHGVLVRSYGMVLLFQELLFCLGRAGLLLEVFGAKSSGPYKRTVINVVLSAIFGVVLDPF